jgi:hypothetical protein
MILRLECPIGLGCTVRSDRRIVNNSRSAIGTNDLQFKGDVRWIAGGHDKGGGLDEGPDKRTFGGQV